MKGLKISLIFLAISTVVRLTSFYFSMPDFWYALTSPHVIWPLVDLTQLFICALITYAITSSWTSKMTKIKAWTIQTILFAVLLAVLNEVGLVILRSTFATTDELTDITGKNDFFHALKNLVWYTLTSIRTGALFVLIWIMKDHYDQKQQ